MNKVPNTYQPNSQQRFTSLFFEPSQSHFSEVNLHSLVCLVIPVKHDLTLVLLIRTRSVHRRVSAAVRRAPPRTWPRRARPTPRAPAGSPRASTSSARHSDIIQIYIRYSLKLKFRYIYYANVNEYFQDDSIY